MAFEIRTLDLQDPEQFHAVIELQRKAFPQTKDVEERIRHNAIQASSVFFGAFDGSDLIGMNGFVRHRIFIDGSQQIAYQSCSSATDSDHRGKGIFSRVINHAKVNLAETGVFICGFPNENSTRIFVGPLGFTEVAMRRLLSVRLGMASIIRAFARATHDRPAAVQFDQRALFEWHSAKLHRSFDAATVEESFLWGQSAQQQLFGVSRNVFQIGGMAISDPGHVTPLFESVLARSSAQLFSVAVPAVSAFARSGVGRSLSRRIGSFIVFPLRPIPRSEDILTYGGLADFF